MSVFNDLKKLLHSKFPFFFPVQLLRIFQLSIPPILSFSHLLINSFIHHPISSFTHPLITSSSHHPIISDARSQEVKKTTVFQFQHAAGSLGSRSIRWFAKPKRVWLKGLS